MSNLRKAAEMALEALEEGIDNMWSIRRENSIQALRQVLAESPDSTKTVAEYKTRNQPEQRQWVGLTDEEMKKTWYETQNIMGWYSFEEIARLIEAKLKERNT